MQDDARSLSGSAPQLIDNDSDPPDCTMKTGSIIFQPVVLLP